MDRSDMISKQYIRILTCVREVGPEGWATWCHQSISRRIYLDAKALPF